MIHTKTDECKDKRIHVVITGGTIDSRYEGSRDTVIPLSESIIPEYFRKIGYTNDDILFTTICMKDSRDINKVDLEMLLQTIEQSGSSRILVTHGTYTMPNTARYLDDNHAGRGRIIVLTGSMIPLYQFAESDAPFNLGYTVSQTGHLPPGVYVCMHGRTFEAREATKDLQLGRFYSIFDEK